MASIRPFTATLSSSVNLVSFNLKCVRGIFCRFGLREDSLPVNVPQLQNDVCKTSISIYGSK